MNNRIEFFDEAFKGYEVPKNIKESSIKICNRFNINGICDPMYISNVIAYELNIGDGQGNFNNNKIDMTNFDKLVNRLQFAYGCNIKSNEIITLKNIILNFI